MSPASAPPERPVHWLVDWNRTACAPSPRDNVREGMYADRNPYAATCRRCLAIRRRDYGERTRSRAE